MKYINTSCGFVAVHEAGNIQSEQALIFVHGNSCDSTTFSAQLHSYQLQDYRLIAIDTLGHGASNKCINPSTSYKISSIVNSIIEIIAQLSLSEYIICAHSLGGHFAIQALPKLINCKGILIFCTPPISTLASFADAFLPNSAFNTLMQQHPSTDEIALLVNEFTENTAIQDLLTDAFFKTDPNFRKILADNIPEHFNSDSYVEETEILANTSLPVCIIQGENERIVNYDYISKLNIPTLFDKKIHLTQNASHFPQLENVSDFNAKLLQFAKHCFSF